MPRIAWATDLHFEFCNKARIMQFAEDVQRARPDMLLLAGDTATAESLTTALELLQRLVPCPIYFVLGNHDFYHGGIASVRRVIDERTAASHSLRWLPAVGVVSVSAETAIIGVDGWADARYGDYEGSSIRLNDFRLIAEYRGLDQESRKRLLNRLGDEEAALLRELLWSAATSHRRLVVVTHVPPFREAAWHEGQPSEDSWAPFFACKATGDVLVQFAEERPEVEVMVLCGHTHGNGEYAPLPSLRVLTGGATYGDPVLQGNIDMP